MNHEIHAILVLVVQTVYAESPENIQHALVLSVMAEHRQIVALNALSVLNVLKIWPASIKNVEILAPEHVVLMPVIISK